MKGSHGVWGPAARGPEGGGSHFGLGNKGSFGKGVFSQKSTHFVEIRENLEILECCQSVEKQETLENVEVSEVLESPSAKRPFSWWPSTPERSYSREWAFPSQNPSYCKTHSKPPSKNLSREPSPEPPQNLLRTLLRSACCRATLGGKPNWRAPQKLFTFMGFFRFLLLAGPQPWLGAWLWSWSLRQWLF